MALKIFSQGAYRMLLSKNTISGKEISSLSRAQGYSEYVKVKCENCLNIREIKYSSFLHLQYSNNNDGKTLCKSCGPKVKLGKIIDEQTIELIVQEYLNGSSMFKLQKKFKKSNRKIYEILVSSGVKIKKRLRGKKGFRVCYKCGVQQQKSNFINGGNCVPCRGETPGLYIKKEKNLKKRPTGKWVNEWYVETYRKQGGRCLICLNVFEKLSIDHCHSSGKLRALICNLCNSGIGLFLENIEIMENAINYLKGSQNVDQ